MSDQNKQHVNQRERIMGFIYVALFFAIVTALCSYFLLRNSPQVNVFSQKELVVRKMDRLKEFQAVQSSKVVMCDSLFKNIMRFNPSVNAKYEENDIDFLIGELRNMSRENVWDRRFMVFRHTADLYEMYFTDKRDLWSKQQNIIEFKQNLEACEIGLQKKNDELNVKK